MSPIDEEITALLLTRAIDPVPQVRAAAGALAREIEVNGPLATHLESSLEAVSRDFGWEVAQEARFLVTDLNLTPGLHAMGRTAHSRPLYAANAIRWATGALD
jgi:hypothetical protein